MHYQTGVSAEKLMPLDEVVAAAKQAKHRGATRFCMAAAWRGVRDGKSFDQVLKMVEEVSAMGMESCCTLGLIDEEQARRLKNAGLYAYNHNIDSSKRIYQKIITTRDFEDRLKTIENVRKAGISVCTGVILGMGEEDEDQIEMLHTLSELRPQPESVPINMLVPIKGTPLGDNPPVEPLKLIRFIAAARVLMPKTMLRLSAGRHSLSDADHLFCFYAGVNSIFIGDKLLTTANRDMQSDSALLQELSLQPEVFS
jgi:biotin synthase